VEAWLGRPDSSGRAARDPAHANFWRADRGGRLILMRGLDEDGDRSRVDPGTTFEITLPVCRVGEAILFLRRLSRLVGAELSINCRCHYVGLRGRRLIHLEGRRILSDTYVSEDNEFVIERRLSARDIDDNLPEVLHEMLLPLYERFSFF